MAKNPEKPGTRPAHGQHTDSETIAQHGHGKVLSRFNNRYESDLFMCAISLAPDGEIASITPLG
ncbi:MAG: hypothetical protein KAQ66_06395 [Rhodospirillaceae bacterium]|nr:hypothetical protein [Rhodospirillaceae bacterium]